MAATSPAREIQGGSPKLEEKTVEEEREQEEKAAAMAADQDEETLQPQRRKGPAGEEPMEAVAVQPELHSLENRWALWFFKNDSSQAWQDNLHLIIKFDTVEDFWAVYGHIQLASKLSSGCDYALFKDGIRPMWEDSRNKRGGRWLVSLAKHQRHSKLDRLWLETVSGHWDGHGRGWCWLEDGGQWVCVGRHPCARAKAFTVFLLGAQLLCLIGESFEEHSQEVCGAVVNIRTKGDKISVWTREAENQASVLHIGHVYKQHLGLSTKAIIGYQAHADTATKSTRNKFVV
ncbi:eukaryotic translation initiation factor 4E type 1B isoform X1 [Echinops telfairi]|uniref:Eukaryotic translation initiation factor 4E type 1B isoform X1 n=1 Tax=Echinops telfairi TaxID=9371 RepID=A0AC55CKF8_ECHTE|nr:eukaryotic translation initiation factor 4E type 1B isoform X1 [Echinops telfairi]